MKEAMTRDQLKKKPMCSAHIFRRRYIDQSRSLLRVLDPSRGGVRAHGLLGSVVVS